MEGTYLRAMRCPVYRRRDSHPGFRTELENLVGDAKAPQINKGINLCSAVERG
jgi:hypothetical protein